LGATQSQQLEVNKNSSEKNAHSRFPPSTMTHRAHTNYAQGQTQKSKTEHQISNGIPLQKPSRTTDNTEKTKTQSRSSTPSQK